MAFNYTSALELMQDGNITGAVVTTYTTPLGPYAWWVAVFGTLIITYIKTQSPGLTAMIGMILLFGMRFYLGAVGDFAFAVMMTVGAGILMFQFWRKD